MEVSTLKINVTDEVVVHDFTAPAAVEYPVPSPFFQPKLTIRVEKEVDWSTGRPRGPTVVLDIEDLAELF